jgi:hypothetical protein
MRSRISLQRSGSWTRSIPSIPTLAPEQTIVSAWLLTLSAALLLGLGVMVGIPALPLLAATLSGVVLAVGVQWLSTTRWYLMLTGGILIPAAAGGLLCGAGFGILASGVVGGISIALTGFVTGLGWGGLVTTAFSGGRPRIAARRYLFTLFVFTALGGALLAMAGGLFDSFVGTVLTVLVQGVHTLTTTTRPVQAAGPTLLLLSGGFYLLRAICVDFEFPYLFTEETQRKVEVAATRFRRVATMLVVASSVLGLATLFGTAAGLIGSLSFAPLILEVLSLVGSSVVRWLVIGLIAVAIVVLAIRSARRVADTFDTVRIISTVFPLIGVTGYTVALMVLIHQLRLAELLQQSSLISEFLSGADGSLVAALVLTNTVLVASALLQAIPLIVSDKLPSSRTAIGVLGGGLALLPVAMTLHDGSHFVVLASIALVVSLVDMTRFGATVQSEVGRRGTLRTELLHGTAGVGVGSAGLLLGMWAATEPSIAGAALTPVTYVLAFVALLLVLVFVGLRLSA